MHFGELHQFLWCPVTRVQEIFSRFTWLNENTILNQANAKHLYFCIYTHVHTPVCLLSERKCFPLLYILPK